MDDLRCLSGREGFEAMASVLTVAEGVATISLCREKERLLALHGRGGQWQCL